MKKWQHICDHNSGIPRRILVSFAYLETEMNALWKQSTYLFILHVTQTWRHSYLNEVRVHYKSEMSLFKFHKVA